MDLWERKGPWRDVCWRVFQRAYATNESRMKRLFFTVLMTLWFVLANSASSWATEQTLSLSAFITDEYIVIGANGNFSPNFYYTTEQTPDGIHYKSLKKRKCWCIRRGCRIPEVNPPKNNKTWFKWHHLNHRARRWRIGIFPKDAIIRAFNPEIEKNRIYEHFNYFANGKTFAKQAKNTFWR